MERRYFDRKKLWEANMPIILWFLGVPLGLIVVLYLLHVI